MKKDAPDWDQLAKDAKAFTEMAEALKTGASPYASPEKYVASSAELAKAAKDKDYKAAAAAFAGLTKSCAACHYWGGPPK